MTEEINQHPQDDKQPKGKKKKKPLEGISFVPTPDGDFLLTIEEAAYICKTSERTMQRDIEEKKMPLVKIRSMERIRWSVLTGNSKGKDKDVL